jgi:hypothetical protein
MHDRSMIEFIIYVASFEVMACLYTEDVIFWCIKA